VWLYRVEFSHSLDPKRRFAAMQLRLRQVE
jgi:hypothetical protein